MQNQAYDMADFSRLCFKTGRQWKYDIFFTHSRLCVYV